ncbi:MAG: TAXI family TRAP transporter solute-binding subunit [Proteobacteria bacterium]|nr:TAXI family TRAP transporter solute-binding subunit [Pseudomonadota bacterium]
MSVAVLCVVSLSATDAAAQQKRFTMGGAGIGSTAYVQAAALADVITKNSQKIALTAQTTRGYVENARLVNTGEMDMAVCGTTIIYPALRGIESFKEGKKENLRGVASAGASSHSFITLKSKNFKSIADLAGKRVNVGPPGSNTAYLGELTLKAYGILDKIHKSSLGFADAAGALRDGKIDAYSVAGDPPIPAVIETFALGDGMILPLDDAIAKKIMSSYPMLSPVSIAAGDYQGLKAPIPVLGYRVYMIINQKVPDWVPYELLSVMMKPDNLDKLIAISHKWSTLKDKNAPELDGMANIGLKLHPGAEKFWKERGVKIPAAVSTLK